jgi:DNA repair exonuclease SbcCD ATPase subunit
MPSVRDTLKSMLAGRKGQQEPQQGVQQGEGGPDAEAARMKDDAMSMDESHGQAQDLIAERLKMVAEQRVALAQAEIKKQEQNLQQMQEQLKELTKQGLPVGSLTDDIDKATQRLNESKAEFSRANEAKQNIDLTRSLRQDSTDSSTEIGSEKVREKLGGPPGGTKVEGQGPRTPGHRR